MRKLTVMSVLVIAIIMQLSGCNSAGSAGSSDSLGSVGSESPASPTPSPTPSPTGAAGSVGSAIGSAVDSVKSFIKGDVKGELNKSYSTKWFDFTVKTIKSAYEYDEYEAGEGYKFVIVRVSETNTFDEQIPMSVYDFNLVAEGLLDEDSWGLEALNDDMMPEEFILDIGESVEYDVVFVIPDEITDIGFVYIEIDDQDNIYATFTIKHSL